MSNELNIATAYVAAVTESRFDDATALFTPDAVMDSPMGEKKGRDAIRSTISVLARLGGELPAPVEEGGVILTRFRTPMGKATMRFSFRDDLISEIRVKQGH